MVFEFRQQTAWKCTHGLDLQIFPGAKVCAICRPSVQVDAEKLRDALRGFGAGFAPRDPKEIELVRDPDGVWRRPPRLC